MKGVNESVLCTVEALLFHITVIATANALCSLIRLKVLHPNKRSSEHTQIMHMYLKIRKEGDKCHELPQYHQVLIEL